MVLIFVSNILKYIECDSTPYLYREFSSIVSALLAFKHCDWAIEDNDNCFVNVTLTYEKAFTTINHVLFNDHCPCLDTLSPFLYTMILVCFVLTVRPLSLQNLFRIFSCRCRPTTLSDRRATPSTFCTNIDLKLRIKSHGPMYYNTCVTCVYNRHVLYTLL